MINNVTLIGNIGKDPELRTLESGAIVAKFSVATSESYKDKNGEWQTQTEWHNVVMWRELAERAQKILKKGNRVYIEGKVAYRKWEDKDGNNRYMTEIVGRTFRTLERRENTESESVTKNEKTKLANKPAGDTPYSDDDDLPF